MCIVEPHNETKWLHDASTQLCTLSGIVFTETWPTHKVNKFFVSALLSLLLSILFVGPLLLLAASGVAILPLTTA